MKGQYLAVEWVFFFAIGIILVIMVFSIFSTVGLTYRNTVVELQLMRSGELLRNGIVNVFEASKFGGENIYMNVSIPPQLSRCIYTIEIGGGELSLRCVDNPGLKAVLNLYDINTNSENIIYSTNGLVKLWGNNGLVKLS